MRSATFGQALALLMAEKAFQGQALSHILPLSALGTTTFGIITLVAYAEHCCSECRICLVSQFIPLC